MDRDWVARIGAQHFIGNRWVDGASRQSLEVIDPSDGRPFAKIARGNAADIDDAIMAARGACSDGLGDWGRLTATERGRLLMKLAQRVLDSVDELGLLESRTTGKPLKQGRADATALARYFEYYAGAADKLHGETIPYSAGMTVLTIREPHGVTGHIIPWNYPMQIFGRSVGAALAAGNACVVKPAEDACLSLLRVAELAADVGFPDGALNIVTGLGSEAGAALAAHPGIDHISFTGSPITGSAVAQAAAKHHCPVTLELGGKSPQLVFADADLDAVVPVVVNAIIQNAGQTCSAGSRLLVERPVYEDLIARVGEAISRLRVGPALADLDLGPLIR
jgi:aldehyde dehydrogenase (NAD+)